MTPYIQLKYYNFRRDIRISYKVSQIGSGAQIEFIDSYSKLRNEKRQRMAQLKNEEVCTV